MKQQGNERTPPYPLTALEPLSEGPLVSLVIPVFNEERFIGALLNSLAAQTYPASSLEVIVADGGSTDGTRKIVARAQVAGTPAVTLVENRARHTAEGLNAGIAASHGDVIIILGAHALVDTAFVAESVRALRGTGAAAAGGVLEARGEGPVGAAIAAALSSPFGVGDARFRFATSPGYVDTVAFAAYRRECFDVLGGFDEGRQHAEDDFFNYRIRAAGGRVFLTPAIRSVYYTREALVPLARQYFSYGRAKGRSALEAPGSIRPRHLVPALTVLTTGALAAASLVSGLARWALGTAGAAYLALSATSAYRSNRRRGTGGLAPLTMLAFATVHVSYGVGTLVGAGRAWVGRRLTSSRVAGPGSRGVA